MAAFNKVVLVGRLTRDCETRSFSTGGMVAKFGFAVSNRKKNSASGQWEDSPMFIDCEVFNRGEHGKTATFVSEYCRKGSQILVEGRLELDTWQDKATGANRQKHKIVVDSVQLLDAKGIREQAPQEPQQQSDTANAPVNAAVDSESIPF